MDRLVTFSASDCIYVVGEGDVVAVDFVGVDADNGA